MNKDRLAAYHDAVTAVIVTIMVLELKPPHGTDMASLLTVAPLFLSYVLSFIYVSIYWSNHHHFFALVEEVDGAILWANIHLLFWISLVPFTTAWMGEHPAAPIPVAVYGVSLIMPAIAWLIMQNTIIHRQGEGSKLKAMIGRDLKGKLSPVLYLAGIASAFFNAWLADAFYLAVSLMWLVPDRRVERMVMEQRKA